MEFPITNKQVSTRFSQEELELLNEVIQKLFPDQDFADPTLTMRSLLVKIIETADLKLQKLGQSKPEDLARIEQLKKELESAINDLSVADKNYCTVIEQKNKEISELEARNAELEAVISEHEARNPELVTRISQLEKYAPVPGEMRIIVEPLTLKLLILYSEKISRTMKREVTCGEILTKFFTQYITKRLTQFPGWPFLISDQEIAALAKELENE